MKHFLTTIFILIAMIAIIISYSFNIRWSGIIAWSLAIVFLLIAANFTKYIPEKKKKKADKNKHTE